MRYRRLSIRLRNRRRLVELGLAVKISLAAGRRAARAAEVAHPEERAHRQRQLTKGPEEFREVRVDRPKLKK